MGKKQGIFLASLLNLFIFMGLIKYIFNMSGLKFIIELIFLLALMLFAVISVILIYNRISSGYVIASIVSSLALINLLAIYFRMEASSFLFLSIASAITLFVMGVTGIAGRRSKKQVDVPSPPVYIEKYNQEQKTKKGKFVSGKTGKYYHSPDCSSVKKIKSKTYYNSAADVKKKGLKPHNCVRK